MQKLTSREHYDNLRCKSNSISNANIKRLDITDVSSSVNRLNSVDNAAGVNSTKDVEAECKEILAEVDSNSISKQNPDTEENASHTSMEELRTEKSMKLDNFQIINKI